MCVLRPCVQFVASASSVLRRVRVGLRNVASPASTAESTSCCVLRLVSRPPFRCVRLCQCVPTAPSRPLATLRPSFASSRSQLRPRPTINGSRSGRQRSMSCVTCARCRPRNRLRPEQVYVASKRCVLSVPSLRKALFQKRFVRALIGAEPEPDPKNWTRPNASHGKAGALSIDPKSSPGVA